MQAQMQTPKRPARLVRNEAGQFEVQATNMAHEVLGTFPNKFLAEMFLEQVNSLCSDNSSCPCNSMENGFAAA